MSKNQTSEAARSNPSSTEHAMATPPTSACSLESLLKVLEVAETLRLSQRAVWRLVSAQKLAYIRIGGAVRFRRSDVAALIRAGSSAVGGA